MSTNPADFNQLAYYLGQPTIDADLKSRPEDFIVEEVINYPLSGEGEHLWCWVEKRCQNTDWVAGMLAKWANTSKRNVGYAGQKDRNAVTRQWFSIHLPGKPDPEKMSLEIEGVQILQMRRHNRKLQRGGLAGNRFELRLRNLRLSQSEEVDASNLTEATEQRLSILKEQGFPNYYGTQRFGWNGNNLVEAEKLLQAAPQKNSRGRRSKQGNRNQQSLYLSALRSWMFNELLSLRVEQTSWNRLIPGDVLQLNGSGKWFCAESEDQSELQQRVESGDLHPSGALFGDGRLETSQQALLLEQTIVDLHPTWMEGLCRLRVQPDRRALRTVPEQLNWQWRQAEDSLDLQLSFFLPSGCFATMLLRELFNVYEPEKQY